MSKINKKFFQITIAIVILVASYVVSSHNYILFHSFAESFCIVLCCAIFIVTMSSVRYSSREFDYITYIGISYIFVAFLNTLHMLSYKGMNIFNEYNYYGDQLSIASRYFQSVSLLIPLLFLKYKKKMKISITLLVYSLTTVAVVLSIFYFKIFPTCYIRGKGQTDFKVISESVVSLILITTIILVKKNNNILNQKVYKYVFWSIFILVIAELPVFGYNYKSGSLNIIGHYIKMISCYILYEAAVIVSIVEPNQIAHNELEARKRAINKYKYLFNSIDEAFCIVELIYGSDGIPFDYRYIEVNPAFKKHTGLSNVLGKRASNTTPYQTETLIIIYEKVATTGVPIRYVFESKEVKRWYSIYAFKIDNQESARVAVLFRDITEEVKARNDMENSIKMQDEIFANISHELKTPLNVIFSTVQLLELYSNNNLLDLNRNKVMNSIKIIKQNCYRFTKLINNIVDLSKMDSGFMKYDMKNGNIVEVVENIVESISEFIKESQLNIIFDTYCEEKIIVFDGYKIERVMLNLISNAIKFSNKGDTIYVNILDKGDFVEISVRDSGVGIDEKYLETIFERFHQVDKTLSRNAEGSGIGLSLVKSIIDMHQGKILLESELGKGSTFKILLPAITIECLEDDQQISVNNDKIEMINIEFSDIYKQNS